MPDVHTPAQRSFNMSKIRSKDTRPEKLLRHALSQIGVRYRLSPKLLPGRPDIVIRRASLVIFVDGCFWHGCRWHYQRPKTNAGKWSKKHLENKARDKRVNIALKKAGWRVIRVWEHNVRNDLANCVEKIVSVISKRS